MLNLLCQKVKYYYSHITIVRGVCSLVCPIGLSWNMSSISLLDNEVELPNTFRPISLASIIATPKKPLLLVSTLYFILFSTSSHTFCGSFGKSVAETLAGYKEYSVGPSIPAAALPAIL